MPILKDRHGRALEVGQRIRVQQYTGRYGQTGIVEGVIQKMYPPHPWVTIKLDDGTLKTPSLEWDGYHKHVDFEHGHETWTEIV